MNQPGFKGHCGKCVRQALSRDFFVCWLGRVRVRSCPQTFSTLEILCRQLDSLENFSSSFSTHFGIPFRCTTSIHASTLGLIALNFHRNLCRYLWTACAKALGRPWRWWGRGLALDMLWLSTAPHQHLVFQVINTWEF